MKRHGRIFALILIVYAFVAVLWFQLDTWVRGTYDAGLRTQEASFQQHKPDEAVAVAVAVGAGTAARDEEPKATLTLAPKTEEVPNRSLPRSAAVARHLEVIGRQMEGATARDAACRVSYEHVDVQQVKACVNNEDAPLQYPKDAEVHFNELRKVFAEYSHFALRHSNRKYMPRFDDEFVHRQEQRYQIMLENEEEDGEKRCLPDIFGPYIPIMVPWNTLWWDKINGGEARMPELQLRQKLLSSLRKDVPYLIVAENGRGWAVESRPFSSLQVLRTQFPGITVMSCGGYGHVPVPLFLNDISHLRKPAPATRDEALAEIAKRPLVTSYVGSLEHAPRNMRHVMDETMKKLNETRTRDGAVFYKFYYGENWTDVMLDTRFNLVPRGFGRTAYHLMETLQLGRIPTFIHLDTPWIPYSDLLLGGNQPIAYKTDIDGLSNLVTDVLLNLTDQDVYERETRILSLCDSHFSVRGAMQQIDLFMSGAGDLRCRTPPDSWRDE